MKLSQFKFNLPESLLASEPSENRDESRLMVLHRDSKDRTIEKKATKSHKTKENKNKENEQKKRQAKNKSKLRTKEEKKKGRKRAKTVTLRPKTDYRDTTGTRRKNDL